MKPIAFLRPAEDELIDAARFYESQAPGLGREYLDSMDAAIADISENPERWPVIRNGVRRSLIHRFPYALLYRVEAETVIILAAMHLRRHPDYWIDR